MSPVEGPDAALRKTEVATTLPLSDQIAEGTEVAGRYRILSLVGQGGMGTVYRAEHLLLRKVFALKVLQLRNIDGPAVTARFEREAIAAARMEHPNVVPATDFGRLPDGAFFLVLEFVDGRGLRSELNAGAMRVPRALGIMRGIVAGVCAAHEKGIIHRDLKPENIMLVEREGNRDFVKLLDFGIARMDSEKGDDGPKLTEVGATLGTPKYMSPEQILGRAVDARSDLYTLGVILFELLTGQCPFGGNFARLLEQHVTAPPPELPPDMASQEPRLAEILRKLLSKEPEQRFQTAMEFAAALKETSLHRAEGPHAASPANSPVVQTPSVGRFWGGLGSRTQLFLAKLASSASGVASWGISRARETVSSVVRLHSDRRLARGRQKRLARTIVAARQLTRQTVISGRRLASSAKGAWSSAIDYCRTRSNRRVRVLMLAIGCVATLGLTVLLVVMIRSGQGTEAAGSATPSASPSSQSWARSRVKVGTSSR